MPANKNSKRFLNHLIRREKL